MDVRPDVLLQTALDGRANTAAELRFGSGASAVVFRSGQVPAGAQTMTINLDNGWKVETLGVVDHGGVFGGGGGLPLLAAGMALSLLLGALIYVLGSGRAHSRVLVDARTDELRFQALHDSLTGLPNRALIMDRIEQLLARNRRNGTAGAALYIDLDDFKNVNDSLGHEVGDRLLASVATRLAGTLRGADTIGRMGGDEFVVLIDGSEPMVAPELVAERLLDVMRAAVRLRRVVDVAARLHQHRDRRGRSRQRVANCSVTRILRCTRPKPRGRIVTSSSILSCRPISADGSGSNSICDRHWRARSSACSTSRSTTWAI